MVWHGDVTLVKGGDAVLLGMKERANGGDCILRAVNDENAAKKRLIC